MYFEISQFCTFMFAFNFVSSILTVTSALIFFIHIMINSAEKEVYE